MREQASSPIEAAKEPRPYNIKRALTKTVRENIEVGEVGPVKGLHRLTILFASFIS